MTTASSSNVKNPTIKLMATETGLNEEAIPFVVAINDIKWPAPPILKTNRFEWDASSTNSSDSSETDHAESETLAEETVSTPIWTTALADNYFLSADLDRSNQQRGDPSANYSNRPEWLLSNSDLPVSVVATHLSSPVGTRALVGTELGSLWLFSPVSQSKFKTTPSDFPWLGHGRSQPRPENITRTASYSGQPTSKPQHRRRISSLSSLSPPSISNTNLPLPSDGINLRQRKASATVSVSGLEAHAASLVDNADEDQSPPDTPNSVTSVMSQSPTSPKLLRVNLWAARNSLTQTWDEEDTFDNVDPALFTSIPTLNISDEVDTVSIASRSTPKHWDMSDETELSPLARIMLQNMPSPIIRIRIVDDLNVQSEDLGMTALVLLASGFVHSF